MAHAAGSMGTSPAAGPTPHARIPQPVTPSAARSLRCPTPAAGLHARDSSRSMRNDKYSSIRVGAALVAALVTGGAGAHKGRPYTAVCGRRSVPTTSTGSTRRGRAGDRTRSVGARFKPAPPPPTPCHTDQLTCKANSSPSTSSPTASGPRGTGMPAPRIRRPSTGSGTARATCSTISAATTPQRSRDRAGADPPAAGTPGLGRLPAAAGHDAQRGHSRSLAVR